MSYRIFAGLYRSELAQGVVLRVFLILTAALVFTLLQTSQLIAQTTPLGDREKVLTITVYDATAESGDSREYIFSIKDLEEFPLVSVSTETQWTNGVLHFRGPLMRDILDDIGAVGDTIQVNGLDGRSATIPREDIYKFDVIIACQVEGAYFGLRDRGPLWIIYPWTDNPEIQSAIYYDRGIYHLSSLSAASQ